MTKDIKRLRKKLVASIFAIVFVFTTIPLISLNASAENYDTVVVVSLGDSYSSGEGIEPFYGQDQELSEKVKDEDWLAHRSEKAWPTLLEIPGLSGKTGDYNVKTTDSVECKWYFGAVSGAETKHFNTEKQKKSYKKDKPGWFTGDYEGEVELPLQLDVFNDISEDVDYVTLTVGGNDVGFADIITTCATGSTYLHFGKDKLKLEKKMDDLWSQFDVTEENIKQVYKDIQTAAGPQADIIVAGYPKLLDKDGKGAVISEKEATIVNENVSKFNDKIESIVNECREEGINVYFVDVESEFDKDGGHQAYSSNAWINKIMLSMNDEDLTDSGVGSAYSVHPNEEGAKAYARCVNAKIQEISETKKTGTLSGKICKASDRTSPVSEASINVYKNEELVSTTKADSAGNYELELPIADYCIVIQASGYVDFTSYATVTENTNTYMETFLLVQGTHDEQGMVLGNVNDALTGVGINGVELTIKQGWNNPGIGNDIYTTTTGSETNGSNGFYFATLPLGNYTVLASKDGYVSSTFNIIVQEGRTEGQNGVLSPINSDDAYRIVLTWGENPKDLDSHVEGQRADGSSFHVYYHAKSAYDGSLEVCNLDVDDVTSYGPETITLKANNEKTYYYYIFRYAGLGTVASSAAKINVYQGNNLIRTFNVPTNLGESDYWNVFAIKNGELIVENTITDYADTNYAN